MQSELDAFFANLANCADLLREVSAQAFAKARMQVSSAAFELLNDQFLALVDARFGFPLFGDAAAPCKQDARDHEIAATPCEVLLIRQMFGHKARVLVTSLLDMNAILAAAFEALYQSRWRIEEAFKRNKHRLALEQLSGMSWLAAQQDLGAKLICENINALAVHAAKESLDPNTCARYLINRSDALSRIKRTLGRGLLHGREALDNTTLVFDKLIENLVHIKPDRSYPRDFTQKRIFHMPTTMEYDYVFLS